jgi:Ala-tRNA(Pro) deacylase
LPGDKVFKTKYLSSQLGCARLSFADEAHMTAMLDIHPGAVSPMGLINETASSPQPTTPIAPSPSPPTPINLLKLL